MVNERDTRARRFDLGQQVDETREYLRAHRKAAIIMVVVAGIGFSALGSRPPSFGLARVSVGDCLYLETPSSKSVVPVPIPIGTLEEVQNTLANDGAQAATCSGSHGHEVSAVIELAESAGDPYPGLAALQSRVSSDCVAAFEPFIGRALGASAYDTVAVVPSASGWTRGDRRAACLVFGRDGRFLDHQARDSGE